MDLGISGRRAIVCASSRGLGRGCAMALAEAGVDVVLNGRDPAVLARTADEVASAHGVEVTSVAADVSTAEGQAKLLEACPRPDILVTNNGGPPFRDFRDLDREAMLTGVTMNMITPIELVRATVDHMVAQRFGRIVNITSISVMMPVYGLDLSSGARAGLTAFMAGVARSVASSNVTINHLQPGYFDTDRMRGGLEATARQLGREIGELETERRDEVPARRFGSAEEFGRACAFLCSTHAGYITGQSLLLDGGLYRSAF